MSLFEELRKDLELYLSAEEIANINRAFLFAEEAHTGQKRVSGEDYITHPVAVAKILASMHLDAETIQAAILHDVIEDTGVEKHVIASRFGDEVAKLVDGTSKLTQIKFESKAEAQAENFRKMIMAMTEDIRVIIIKLADRLHNMRTVNVFRPDKKHRIARETLEIYAPIANRLGMHKFTLELEELGFAACYPLRYRILNKSVRKARGNRKEIIQEIEKGIKDIIAKHKLPIILIKGREKHLYSIYKKMRVKKTSFAEIMDVYAFRIITKDIDGCYRVLGLMHQLYKPVPQRFKDYIAIPKANGYQSLHTTLFGPYGVPIEIQIRTKEMEQTAENGIAAHWLYKIHSHTASEAQIKARAWLKNLMELQESTANPIEFIENVKIDLFPDEVYVFTPKGDIMELPAGASAVDFAYSVHTDIGNSCIAAKINRRLAPLSTPLSNGQTVEIITAPGARPNLAWINFVVTSKARSGIRHFAKEQKRSDSIKLGKHLLAEALAGISVGLEDINNQQWLEIIKHYRFKKRVELFEAIGLGNLLPIGIASFISNLLDMPKTTEAALKRKTALKIKGSQGMLVNFAKCCRPIPGDPIIGVFITGSGLLIHMEQCPHIVKLCTNPEKCVAVQWAEKISGEFQVDLLIEVANLRGVLAQITSAVSSADANIDDISLKASDSRFSIIRLTVSVQDRIHLAKVMRRVRAVKAVNKISREK